MKTQYVLSPEVETKLAFDTEMRLKSDGTPVHVGNDYERHLYARKLRIEGKTKTEIRAELFNLGMGEIPVQKQSRYLDDIINSVLVGFPGCDEPYFTGEVN